MRRREQDAHGRHRRRRLKIVVRRLHWDPTLPPTGEGADFDDSFGVHRDPQDVVGLSSAVIQMGDLLEERVGFGDFLVADFWRPAWESTQGH
jgi:hypothetical protein